MFIINNKHILLQLLNNNFINQIPLSNSQSNERAGPHQLAPEIRRYHHGDVPRSVSRDSDGLCEETLVLASPQGGAAGVRDR